MCTESCARKTRNGQVGVKPLPVEPNPSGSHFDRCEILVGRVMQCGNEVHRDDEGRAVGQDDVEPAMAAFVSCLFGVRRCVKRSSCPLSCRRHLGEHVGIAHHVLSHA